MDSNIWDVMKEQEGGQAARPGLQKKSVLVHRGGKAFQSTRDVRPGEVTPAAGASPRAAPKVVTPDAKIIEENVHSIYDSGPGTGDRYTVVLKPSAGWVANSGHHAMLGFNENPTHPQHGVSQFSEGKLGSHLGKPIKFEDLPQDLQRHVIGRVGPDSDTVKDSSGPHRE